MTAETRSGEVVEILQVGPSVYCEIRRHAFLSSNGCLSLIALLLLLVLGVLLLPLVVLWLPIAALLLPLAALWLPIATLLLAVIASLLSRSVRLVPGVVLLRIAAVLRGIATVAILWPNISVIALALSGVAVRNEALPLVRCLHLT